MFKLHGDYKGVKLKNYCATLKFRVPLELKCGKEADYEPKSPAYSRIYLKIWLK